MAEQKLAQYIHNNKTRLDNELRIRLNALRDPAGCASFAKSRLQQLRKHNCSPPADLVRILQVIAQVPAKSVLLKEKFEFIQDGATGNIKTNRQTVRWQDAGIRLQPILSLHSKQRKNVDTKKYLCHCFNIALCIACTKKSAITCMAMHRLLKPTGDLS